MEPKTQGIAFIIILLLLQAEANATPPPELDFAPTPYAIFIPSLKAAAEAWKTQKTDTISRMAASYYSGYVISVIDEYYLTGWCQNADDMRETVLNQVYEALEKTTQKQDWKPARSFVSSVIKNIQTCKTEDQKKWQEFFRKKFDGEQK